VRFFSFLRPAFTILLTISTLFGCTSEFSDSPRIGGGGLGTISSANIGSQEFGSFPSSKFPWELWQVGRDLKGEVINDPFIVKGDELNKKGEAKEALNYYQRAAAQQLAFPIKEALAIRISSSQLSLDQAKEALVTLSQYFRINNLDVSNVEARFSVIFAYAYGRIGDLDQSLAWFSRVHKIVEGKGSYGHSATLGSSLLLRTIPDKELIEIDQIWSSDQFISTVIGHERARRSRMGGTFEVVSKEKPFWSALSEGSNLVTQNSIINNSEAHSLEQISGSPDVVGVLLPLTGRFSNLGTNTLNGITLSFQDTQKKLKVLAKDTQGDSTFAVAAVDQLLAESLPSVVLGPLLSEPATTVVPILRERGIPNLTFSKKDSPIYGGTAFQIGASSASQIESLLNTTASVLNIKRYGIVYSQDSNGYEFLRDFRRYAAEMGLKISYEAGYGNDYRESFVKIAEEIEKTDVEAIFFPDEIDKATVLFSNIKPSFRKSVKALGSASWDNPQKLNAARTLLEGAIFVSPFFLKSQNELNKKFNEIYKKQYGIDPDFLAAQGFDAGTIALAALSRKQSEGLSFIDAFRAIDNYHGLTGKISVTPDGSIRRLFSIIQVSENGLKEIIPAQTQSISAVDF